MSLVRHWRWVSLAVTLTAVLLGCADAGSDTSISIDSNGVRMVEHGPLDDGIRAFELDGPVYEVGWQPGEHEWQSAVSGVLISDARAAVADRLASAVVVLSPSGEVEAILGGRGDGPGEFRSVSAVFEAGVDTIVAVDPSLVRATYFAEGVHSRTENLSPSIMSTMWPIGYDPGVGFLLTSSHWYPYTEEPWIDGSLARYALGTGQVDTLVVFDYRQSSVEGEALNPFASQGWSGITNGALLTARGDVPTVRRFDLEGELLQVIRWEEEPRRFTEQEWDAYVEAVHSRVDPRFSRTDLDEALSRMRGAAHGPLPHITGVRGDDQGRVWVGTYSADDRHIDQFRVFSKEGEFRGWVEMPPRFEVLDIGQNLVLGIQRNELDVEAVAVYRLRE